jgi:hypothetical protein
LLWSVRAAGAPRGTSAHNHFAGGLSPASVRLQLDHDPRLRDAVGETPRQVRYEGNQLWFDSSQGLFEGVFLLDTPTWTAARRAHHLRECAVAARRSFGTIIYSLGGVISFLGMSARRPRPRRSMPCPSITRHVMLDV